MIYQGGFRRWLLALALCVIAVLASVSYVDRPAADFFNMHVRHTELRGWLVHLLGPFVLTPVVALLFLLGLGCWVLSGRHLRGWTLKPMLCSWSAIWALAAEFVFKQIFGRAWPDPGYVENHLYGFRFLHGGPHWDSFPSGTASISAAIVATLWLVAPRLRLPSVFLAVLLCGGVVVTNGHWLSDVIAGGFLGASIGWMTVLLLGSRVPPTHPADPSMSDTRFHPDG
jgi:membrane-associated phospholipid phosphatase